MKHLKRFWNWLIGKKIVYGKDVIMQIKDDYTGQYQNMVFVEEFKSYGDEDLPKEKCFNCNKEFDVNQAIVCICTRCFISEFSAVDLRQELIEFFVWYNNERKGDVGESLDSMVDEFLDIKKQEYDERDYEL